MSKLWFIKINYYNLSDTLAECEVNNCSAPEFGYLYELWQISVCENIFSYKRIFMHTK